MGSFTLLFALMSLGSSFILAPEELSSLLNILYTKLPRARIGMNNTKVGLGFRVGRNVDVQFLVELGPQDVPRPNDSSNKGALNGPNGATTDPNRRQAVQSLLTTVDSQWPVDQNMVATENSPLLPADFISYLRRRRPGNTASTTTKRSVEEDNIDSEN